MLLYRPRGRNTFEQIAPLKNLILYRPRGKAFRKSSVLQKGDAVSMRNGDADAPSGRRSAILHPRRPSPTGEARATHPLERLAHKHRRTRTLRCAPCKRASHDKGASCRQLPEVPSARDLPRSSSRAHIVNFKHYKACGDARLCPCVSHRVVFKWTRCARPSSTKEGAASPFTSAE